MFDFVFKSLRKKSFPVSWRIHRSHNKDRRQT